MNDGESWVRDSGIACSYDGDVIEYTDGVIVTLMVKPYIYQGALMFYDVMTENQDDYFYEPAFFHVKNWDELEEKFFPYVEEAHPLKVEGSLIDCYYCKSGILAGEVMCVATFGEIIRSQRNPDLMQFGNHFENTDRNPRAICISCLLTFNRDIHEIWPDGVCHDQECEQGTVVRCWRDGCKGNCGMKKSGDEEDEEEELIEAVGNYR